MAAAFDWSCIGIEKGLSSRPSHLRCDTLQCLGPGRAIDEMAAKQHDCGRCFSGVGMKMGESRLLAGKIAQIMEGQKVHHRERRGAMSGIATRRGAAGFLMDLPGGFFPR